MPTPRLEHWNADWGEITTLSMQKHLELQGYSVVRYEYASGTRFNDHTHEVDKNAVVSGRLKIRIGCINFILNSGDMIEISAGVIHSAEVIDDENVVSLDATRR